MIEPRPPDPARRRLLRVALLGALGGAAAAAGALRFGGYDDESVPPEARARLTVLNPQQYIVVRAVARRIAAPDRPDDRRIPSPDELDLAGYVDRYLAGMRPPLRRDFLRLLGFVEHVLPLTAGHLSRFTSLDSGAQDAVLRALESSRVSELRAGFDAIKSLVFMGYYADPRTWSLLRYPGPFVGRPEGGFWQ